MVTTITNEAYCRRYWSLINLTSPYLISSISLLPVTGKFWKKTFFLIILPIFAWSDIIPEYYFRFHPLRRKNDVLRYFSMQQVLALLVALLILWKLKGVFPVPHYLISKSHLIETFLSKQELIIYPIRWYQTAVSRSL